MAKRTGQRKRKQNRKRKSYARHPTTIGSTPPIRVGEPPLNEWPHAVLFVLVFANIIAWQGQFVSWFG